MSDQGTPPKRTYDLVSCVTPDSVKLHGLYLPAETPPQTTVNAAVVLHGLGGNFYSSSLNLRLADALNELGIAVVLGNTRGHDGISMNPVGGRAQTIGAAYEIVDDCKNDVAGWVRWLIEKKRHSQIALVGHSLGAIKSLYAYAHLPDAAVQAIVGLSATRLCHSQFLQSERANDFQKWFSRATELVQQGRPNELLHVDFPFPTHMTAGAYHDKYGTNDRYDWIRFADQVDVPTFLMFGERELRDNAAFHGLMEHAKAIAQRLPNFELAVIESANHFYAGVHWRAADAMQAWLKKRLPHGGS